MRYKSKKIKFYKKKFPKINVYKSFDLNDKKGKTRLGMRCFIR